MCSDVVFKSFKVEPEGYYIANSKSVLLCANKTRFDSNVTWSLQVPNDVVEGTIHGLISVNGDILGHSVEVKKRHYEKIHNSTNHFRICISY